METATEPSPAIRPAAIGIIAVGGEDAATFLQAQLSNDVLGLDTGRSRLAAWCDAKGRVQAVVRVLHRDDEFLMLLPRTLIPAVLQRLRLFVLRARVTLRDAGDDLVGYGLIDEPAEGTTPAPGEVAADGQRQYLGLPGPAPRRIAIGPPRALADMTPADDDAWRRAGILAGEPQVYPETQGLFVPQMLNLHWLDGIDFHKGCYPGQEVVARLQYRGKLTRRLFRAHLPAGRTPPPAAAVVDEAGETRGQVADAAPGPDGQDLLAVLRIDAADKPLYIDGAELTLAQLPYPTGE
ncbi:folate-binding protein YgfZ [Salinisphaera sp. PC39]|uniref:CAF17-like 4Fe-4S cluster assembly/insertion protein YgfZ n=1 Tax=Salinisphaera sp. PC39 TaxID=1304156 RepID=UPI00333F35EA